MNGAPIQWTPTPPEQQFFRNIFQNLATNDFIGGKEAVPFLLKSGVGRGVLRAVWSTAAGNSMAVNYRQFCVVLRLVTLCQFNGMVNPTMDALNETGSIQFPFPLFHGINSDNVPHDIQRLTLDTTLTSSPPSTPFTYSKGLTVFYTKANGTDEVKILKLHPGPPAPLEHLTVIITKSYDSKRIGRELDVLPSSGKLSFSHPLSQPPPQPPQKLLQQVPQLSPQQPPLSPQQPPLSPQQPPQQSPQQIPGQPPQQVLQPSPQQTPQQIPQQIPKQPPQQVPQPSLQQQPQQLSPQPPQQTWQQLWHPTEEEDQFFRNIFENIASNGVVHGRDAVPFLLKSGVSREILRAVWSTVAGRNMTIDIRAFCIVLRFVTLSQFHGMVQPSAEELNGTASVKLPLPLFLGINTQDVAQDIQRFQNMSVPPPPTQAIGMGTSTESDIKFPSTQPEASTDKFAALDSIAGSRSDPEIAPLTMSTNTASISPPQTTTTMHEVNRVKGNECEGGNDEFGDFSAYTSATVPTTLQHQPVNDGQNDGEDDANEFGDFAEASSSEPKTLNNGIGLNRLMKGETPILVQQQESVAIDQTVSIQNRVPSEHRNEPPLEQMQISLGDQMSMVKEQVVDPFSTLSTFSTPPAMNIDADPTMTQTSPEPPIHPTTLVAEERFQEALHIVEGTSQTSTPPPVQTIKTLKKTILEHCGQDMAQMFHNCFAPCIEHAALSEGIPSVDTLRKALKYQTSAASFCDLVVGLNTSNGVHRPLLKKWTAMLENAEKEFTTCLKVLDELKQAQDDSTIVSYLPVLALQKFEHYLNGLGEMWESLQCLQTELLSKQTEQVSTLLHKKRKECVVLWNDICLKLDSMGRSQQYSSCSKDGELQALRIWSKKMMFNGDICKISLSPSCNKNEILRNLNFSNVSLFASSTIDSTNT